MEPSMSGIRAKLVRAEFHLDSLGHAFSKFIEKHIEVHDMPPREAGQSRIVEFHVTDPPGHGP
jgi:hypothetical protein